MLEITERSSFKAVPHSASYQDCRTTSSSTARTLLMKHSEYKDQNLAKASFEASYTADTPHRYLQKMTAVDYRMADCMNPFLSAVVKASINSQEAVKVLDVGCSYGMSGALLRADCTYKDLVEFYEKQASVEYGPCVAESRDWLNSQTKRQDIKMVGFDSSEEAVRFAVDSHMVDEGIAVDLEKLESSLTVDEACLIQKCDVLLSTGAIGYVTAKTVDPILDEFGRTGCGALGPVAVLSVLELFEVAPIARAFVEHGYRFEQLPIRMLQRQFVDEEERYRLSEVLRQRGVQVGTLESENKMFANLCIAAKPERFHALAECVIGLHD